MKNEVWVALAEFGKFQDIAINWLYLSWNTTNKYEKAIYRLKYYQYKEQCRDMARRLKELCQTN